VASLKEVEMPYNTDLDQKHFSKTFEKENGRITVSVYSYRNGPKKLQLTREMKDREGNFSYVKLGRLSKEELEAILPLINEAMAAM
jgi:hypothetical protein